jgi:hypothetical protein
MVAAELAAAGVATVPNLYWFRREDLERWVAWCEKAHPPAIALNLQTLRTDSEWRLMGLPGLSYLAAQLPPGIAVIVNGSSRASRIATLRQLFGASLVLVSQNAIQGALHGKVITEHGWEVRHAEKADLFAANVRFYTRLVEG